MALQVCKECTTRYAPAAACPHCGGELWISELAADEQLAAPEAGKPPAAGQDDGDDGPPDYMAYRVVDLRDLARDRGLPVTGAKPDLAAALAQWDAGHPDGMATGGLVDGGGVAQVGE